MNEDCAYALMEKSKIVSSFAVLDHDHYQHKRYTKEQYSKLRLELNESEQRNKDKIWAACVTVK